MGLVVQALPLEDTVMVQLVKITLAENIKVEMILMIRSRDGECGRRDFRCRSAGGSRRDGSNRRRG